MRRGGSSQSRAIPYVSLEERLRLGASNRPWVGKRWDWLPGNDLLHCGLDSCSLSLVSLAVNFDSIAGILRMPRFTLETVKSVI